MNSVRYTWARRCAVATPFVALAAMTAVAAGPRLTASRQRPLIEQAHFGQYYQPVVVASGKNVFAFWRQTDQGQATRTVAVSKNGGKTFANPRVVRVPGLSNILSIVADSSGNVYFGGIQGNQNQMAVVRSDRKLKTFSTGATVTIDKNVAAMELTTGADGRVYLVYQTRFSVFLRTGGTGFADQIGWFVSTDGGATFGDVTLLSTNSFAESDLAPSFAQTYDGSVWLLSVRDDTQARGAAPDTYTGGRIFARRIDGAAAEPVEILRAATIAGQPVRVRGFVAEDGSLGVGWAEQVTDPSYDFVQTVFFAKVTPGGVSTPPAGPLAQVGKPHPIYVERTASGQVAVLAHGSGFDSNVDSGIIGAGSLDDGATFGPISQLIDYPGAQTADATSDGQRIFYLWTDTRQVVFATLVPKASS
jgi:hypothetical protein